MRWDKRFDGSDHRPSIMPGITGTPWPRDRMEQHVRQCIHDYADGFLALERDDDDALMAVSKNRGEDAIWRVVLDAIREAGWRVEPAEDR
jgi:hypothetical protein